MFTYHGYNNGHIILCIMCTKCVCTVHGKIRYLVSQLGKGTMPIDTLDIQWYNSILVILD